MIGMPIKQLAIDGTGVSDLSPVKELPLETLTASGTPITDISPLKGLPLTYLAIHNTKVSDLSSLKAMPLRGLGICWIETDDLSPLKGMQLRSLDFRPERVTEDSIRIIRDMRSLETIIGGPAKEFWAQHDYFRRHGGENRQVNDAEPRARADGEDATAQP